MLKMVDGSGIIGVDMICPLGISTPQPPNYDRVELEGTGMLVLPNSLDAPLERLELGGKTEQVTTRGVNLFDASLAKNKENYKDVTINGAIIRAIELDLKPNTKYAFQCVIRSVSTTMNVGNSTIRYVVSDGQKRVITTNEDGKLYVGFAGNVDSEIGKIGVSIVDIQVEEGDTQTAYEPYTGGKPSPSPEYPQEIKSVGKLNADTQKYEVSVKLTGKNLFDREKAKDNSNWIIEGNGGYAKFPIYVKKGNKITFSYTEKLTTGKKFYLGISLSDAGSTVAWLYRDTTASLINNKYTIAATNDYIYLMCSKSDIQNFVDTIQTLQVEISPTQTDYQTYAEQPLTLTSDRQLTKWDRLVEQGGEIGWLYNSVNETIDGKTGKWSIQPASKIFYRTDITFPIVVPFCIELLGYDYSMGGYKKDAGITINNLGILCITLPEEVELTLDAYKQYLADNPLHVLYKGDSEEFIPLPQSEQNAIRALKTYYPTTVITADGGELDPDIKVTYRKES